MVIKSPLRIGHLWWDPLDSSYLGGSEAKFL